MNVFWYLNSLLQEHLSTNTLPLSHLALEHRLYAEGEIRKMVSPIKKSSKCNESEVNHIVSAILQYHYLGNPPPWRRTMQRYTLI